VRQDLAAAVEDGSGGLVTGCFDAEHDHRLANPPIESGIRLSAPAPIRAPASIRLPPNAGCTPAASAGFRAGHARSRPPRGDAPSMSSLHSSSHAPRPRLAPAPPRCDVAWLVRPTLAL